MKKLLADYGLKTNNEYFWMILESFQNGQKKQATAQFHAMPKAMRKEFVYSLLFELTTFNATEEEQQFFFDLM